MPSGRTPRIDRVGLVMVAVISLLMLVMVGRVAQLQLAPSALLQPHIDDRRVTTRQPAARGDILDRRGRVLATTRFGSRVVVDPTTFAINPRKPKLPATPEAIGEAVHNLADALGVPVDQVADKLVPRIIENDRRARRAAQASLSSTAADPRATELDDALGTATAADPDASTPGKPKPQIRYVVMSGILDDWRAEAVRSLNLTGVTLETRSVREHPAGPLAAAILGKVNVDHAGFLGAERSLDDLMRSTPGSMTFVADAQRNALWMDPGSIQPARRGGNIRLSIDSYLQQLCHDELQRGLEDADAAGGRLVLMDPRTGEILAMLDLERHLDDAVPFNWDTAYTETTGPLLGHNRYITLAEDEAQLIHPSLGRNRCIEHVYEPGSTFKPFMWAAATDLGVASPDDTIDTEHGKWRTPYGRPVEDVTARPNMTWREVLIHSSNIGMTKVTARMTRQQMRDAVVRFGFGRRSGISLPYESPGRVTSQRNWNDYTHTSVAFGYEVAVTPVQIARAFSAFAREDDLAGTLPTVRLQAVDEQTNRSDAVERAVSAKAAMLTRDAMRGMAAMLDDRLARSNDEYAHFRYEIFGKSGTSKVALGRPPKGKRYPPGVRGYFRDQYTSSFVASGPYESPRLVVVVVIDDPGPEHIRKRQHYGSYVAGPVARRVLEQALAYLGVPPSDSMLTRAEPR